MTPEQLRAKFAKEQALKSGRFVAGKLPRESAITITKFYGLKVKNRKNKLGLPDLRSQQERKRNPL